MPKRIPVGASCRSGLLGQAEQQRVIYRAQARVMMPRRYLRRSARDGPPTCRIGRRLPAIPPAPAIDEALRLRFADVQQCVDIVWLEIRGDRRFPSGVPVVVVVSARRILSTGRWVDL